MWPTDQPADGRKDKAGYRVASIQQTDYSCYLSNVNLSWANHILKYNEFPNESRASLIKFNHSQQVS